jgi:hypothetical protein
MSGRRVCNTRLPIGPVIVCLIVAASVPLAAQPPQVSPSSPKASAPPSVPLRDRDWDTMSVDVTVRHWRQMTAGEAPPPTLPTTRYHFERSLVSGQWKTVLTIVDQPALIATSAGDAMHVNTSRIVRIENDEDGTPVRFFNQRGERVTLPAGTSPVAVAPLATTAAPAASGTSTGTPDLAGALQRFAMQQATPRQGVTRPAATRDWAEVLVASPADRTRRKQALERTFGPVVGQVRGLDRVVRVKADAKNVDELLVDPKSGLPLEANTMRNGQLVSQRTFAYEQNAAGDLVRRGIRTESLVPNDSSRHMVVDVEFSHLTFERRR